MSGSGKKKRKKKKAQLPMGSVSGSMFHEERWRVALNSSDSRKAFATLNDCDWRRLRRTLIRFLPHRLLSAGRVSRLGREEPKSASSC